VRGRVGFTTGATGDLMWYGTGGYAYGQFKTSVTQSTAATVFSSAFPFAPATFTSAGAFNASAGAPEQKAGQVLA
jgi:hypothetical protein